MSGKFAKVFDSESYTQIVVIQQGRSDASGDEVRLFFKPDGLGVCSMAFQFNDDDDGYDKADKVFAEMDEDKAHTFVDSAMSGLEGPEPGGE